MTLWYSFTIFSFRATALTLKRHTAKEISPGRKKVIDGMRKEAHKSPPAHTKLHNDFSSLARKDFGKAKKSD
ncbi:hypothetical protein KL86DES1_21755 [uncultured Desulfovibrio sp.]|uniref:Uncharacterized protein n=1 Tax=uncultured Desulfovibrio sp. TaxID=167968 RepID=A0A212L9F4_9BACT|nr:hypothetical protein KL86DES1_21755 [uncultured Desulfovibrio sp.]